MPEKCANDPTQVCRSATRLVLLEKRVEDLETGQTREEEFRKATKALFIDGSASLHISHHQLK